MPSINSNKKDLLRPALYTFLLYCVIIAVAIVWLATQHDSTLLGDPYYEDKILAPQRAFIPWIFTMANVALALVIAVIIYVQKKNT